MRVMLFIMALCSPVMALANEAVSLTSEVFVEKVARDAQGRQTVTLHPPQTVVPGDRLVFVLKYRNQGASPATQFVVTNPIPDAVQFAGAADAGAEFSVDGGRSWGALDTRKVRQADGTMRPASGADVTHVRWALKQAIPANGQGRLSFRGIVK